jgi:O-antigen/teichoic acid export membrane protein
MHSPYSKANVWTNLVHYLLGRGLGGVAGFVFVILLARAMDVQAYAGYTAITGLIAMSGVITGFGLERVVARFVPEARLERSVPELSRFIWGLASFRLCFALLVSVIMYIAWQHIRSIFPDVHLVQFPVQMAILIVAEALFQYFSAVYQALVQQKILTRIMVIQWAGRLLLGGLVLYHYGQITLAQAITVLAIPEVLGVVAFAILLTRHIKEIEQSNLSGIYLESTWPDWPGLVKIALHNYSFTLLASPPQGYFMKIMASLFLPTSMVAAYGFFISLSERVRQYIPLNFVYNLIEPFMVGNYLAKKDFGSLNKNCQLLYKTNLLMLLPLLIWILLCGKNISYMLAGDKFWEYNWIFFLVFFQLTIGSHIVLLQLVLNSVGKSSLLLTSGIVSVSFLFLFWLGVTSINPSWILFGPLVFSVCCNTLIIYWLRRGGFDYSISWHLYKRILIAAFLTYVSTHMMFDGLSKIFHSHVVLSLVVGSLVLLMYALWLYLLKALTDDEIQFLQSIKTAVKKK